MAAVPLFKRLGLGAILGYVAAGAAVGPFGLGLLADVAAVRHVSELGVVLLLFVIGLELNPRRLWRLRGEIFGLGLAQVAATGAALGLALWALSGRGGAALVVGLALALSSTAFGVQLLRERRLLSTPLGDRALSILLLQDMAVVPLLALAAVAGGARAGLTAEGAAVAAAALGGLVLVGRFGLKHAFRLIARVKADEIFTAAALLVVALAALAMQWAGLSPALGAFLAGVLLAGTEFRHQLESDIEPFRTLFLGLFFVGVGMSVDWTVAAAFWAPVVFGALGLFALKGAILWGLARAAGSSSEDALRIGAALGQAGEFGFVVFALARGDGLLSPTEESALTVAVALSMALTPLALGLADRAIARRARARGGEDEPAAAPVARPSRVIVAGFGRVGQVVARIMRMRGHSVTLIDNSPRRIRLARTFGSEVFYGDATRPDVMRAAGAEEAEAVFYCIDDREGMKLAVERLKARWPHLKLFAAAYDRFQDIELRTAGADVVVRETRESAMLLAAEALRAFGDGAATEEVLEEFRRRDEEMLRLQAEHGMEKGAEEMRRRYEVT